MIQTKLNLLSNLSFFLLFFSMFLFWIYTSFFFIFPKKSIKVYGPSDKYKPVSSSISLQEESLENKQIQTKVYPDRFHPNENRIDYGKSKNIFLQLGNLGMLLSNILLFLLLILRWKESGHFPLSNLYESLLFLSWSCTLIHVALIFRYLNINIENDQFSNNLFFSEFTGCITSPCALFTNAFASFCLPEEMQKITPLVPALQSNWLMMHVTVMIFSYSALIVGSLMSIAFLVLTNGKELKKKNKETLSDLNSTKDKKQYKVESNVEGLPSQVASQTALQTSISYEMAYDFMKLQPSEGLVGAAIRSQSEGRVSTKSSQLTNFAEKLDNLSYRIIGLGFPFLTIGILSGAVWANEAWGSYWSWDPKETWALLTWLIFAIYLHTRISKGWEGKKPALIASLGFFIIWICYLGVNLLGEGLHSYGWLSKK